MKTYLQREHSETLPRLTTELCFLGGASGTNQPANERDLRDSDWIPGLGRPPGGGNGNPLQYSSWKIPWTEESVWLQSMELQRVRHDLVTEQQQCVFLRKLLRLFPKEKKSPQNNPCIMSLVRPHIQILSAA